MVSTRDEILEKLKVLKVALGKDYPIASLALFGSYARSEQMEDSDVDILIELDGEIGSRFIDLAEELEKSLGRHVDLVSKKGVKDRYFRSIESELIYV